MIRDLGGNVEGSKFEPHHRPEEICSFYCLLSLALAFISI